MKFHDELNKPGIYKITNIINNKCYIGCCTNFQRRYRKHLCVLKKQKGVNKHLQNAWNKYGEENFVFEIVEIVDYIKNDAELKKSLNIKEQYWVNVLNPCYNIRKICVNTNLGCHWNLSEDTKQKFRNGNRKGKNNYSARPVVLIDLTGNLVAKFDCCKECADYLGIGSANIVTCCKRQTKTLKNTYISLYKNEWDSFYSKNKEALCNLLKSSSKEHKAHIRSLSRLNYYKNNEQAHKQISDRQKRAVLQYDLEGNLLNEFESLLEAKQKTGAKNISSCCTGSQKTSGGFIFKFKNGGRWNNVVSPTAQ